MSMLLGAKSPAPLEPLPAPPTADNSNTSANTTDAARAGPGRAANIVAGQDPSVNSSSEQYSVRKRLLGM